MATSSLTEDNFAEKALTKVPWWRRPDTFALQGEAPKEHLDTRFSSGILAKDGHGSITKTSRPSFLNPGETPGSARGGFVEAVEAGTKSSGLQAGAVYDGKCRPDFFVGCNTEHHRWAFYNLQGVPRFHAIHHCDAADMGSPTGQDCIAFQERGIRLLKDHHTIKSAHYLSLYYEPKPTWKWQSNTPISIMSRPWHRRASTVARQELLKANLKSLSLYGEGQPGGFLFETDKRRVMTDCSCYIAMVGETGGFGLSEHEAMAMGCPVVARRWGDMQDRFPDYPGFADSDEHLLSLVLQCLISRDFAEELSGLGLDYIRKYHTRERFEESAASLVAFATKT